MLLVVGFDKSVSDPQTTDNDNWVAPQAVFNNTPIQLLATSFNETSSFSINGNTDLGTKAANSGWIGDGSKDTPFVIEYLNITGNNLAPAIAISGTSLYITIQHSIFNNATRGISMENVQNVMIFNNTITKSHDGGVTATQATNNNINVSSNIITNNKLHGVYMTSTGKANVSDNQVQYNGWNGMYLRGNDKIVERNTVSYNNHSGIYFDDPINVQVRANIISENSKGGGTYTSLYLDSIGSDNLVEDNYIVSSVSSAIYMNIIDNSIIRNNTVILGGSSGIRLSQSNNNEIYDNIFRLTSIGIYITSDSDNNHVHNNIIYQVQNEGIRLAAATSNTLIHNNTISKSTKYGIRIDLTFTGLRTGNRIYWNNFIKNNDGSSAGTQAYDDHGDANFTSNYWDDAWVGTDGNGDGYIDTPYFVDEAVANTTNDDLKALAEPVNPEQHFGFAPFITEPEDGQIIDRSINRFVEIQWLSVTDYWGHSVSYSLYYSSDGTTWFEIATDITLSWYDWDTAEITSGTDYRLKIVALDEAGYTIEDESSNRFTIAISDHALTPAEITLLSDGDIIDIAYTIRWTFGDSSWNAPISYNLLYSTDNGITWLSFVNDTNLNLYDWVPIAFPNGDYLIRIETMAAGDVVSGTDIAVTVYNPGNVSSIPTSTSNSTSTTTTSITTHTTVCTSCTSSDNPIPPSSSNTNNPTSSSEVESELGFLKNPLISILGAFVAISIPRVFRRYR